MINKRIIIAAVKDLLFYGFMVLGLAISFIMVGHVIDLFIVPETNAPVFARFIMGFGVTVVVIVLSSISVVTLTEYWYYLENKCKRP